MRHRQYFILGVLAFHGIGLYLLIDWLHPPEVSSNDYEESPAMPTVLEMLQQKNSGDTQKPQLLEEVPISTATDQVQIKPKNGDSSVEIPQIPLPSPPADIHDYNALRARLQEIEESYKTIPIERSVISSASLKLLDKAFSSSNQPRKFVVGVTGGSSTAGGGIGILKTWPYLYVEQLKKLGFDVELRNAAQGTTSSSITAPCLAELVGHDVDLLFWEFAMNDGDRVEELFGAQLEYWIRQAMQLKSRPSLGFVYIWTMFKSPWMHLNQSLPVLNHYIPYNDVIGMLLPPILAFIKDNKFEDMVADTHHPKEHVHKMIADLLSLGTLRALLNDAPDHTIKRDPPPFYYSRYVWEYPELMDSRPSCIMSVVPQYAKSNDIHLQCQTAEGRTLSLEDPWQTKALDLESFKEEEVLPWGHTRCENYDVRQDGRADLWRWDRKYRWYPNRCNSGSTLMFNFEGSPDFIAITASNVSNLVVAVDGRPIHSNRPFKEEGVMVKAFYPWLHELKKGELASSSSKVGQEQHVLSLCSPHCAFCSQVERVMLFYLPPSFKRPPP